MPSQVAKKFETSAPESQVASNEGSNLAVVDSQQLPNSVAN